jgi:hypothetical protein
MRKSFLTVAFAAVAALPAAAALPSLAWAHHGWAGQDNQHLTVLEGRIEAVRYRNPHSEIDLTSGGRKWQVTLAPLSRMEARGVTEAALKPGSTVKIEGHRNLDQSRYEVKANSITIGGKTTSLR